MNHSQRLIVFDLETTGLSPKNGDLVIEIGANAIENGRQRYPQLRSHKLENLAKHLLGPAATKNLHLHRALDDARLTAKIWLEMMNQGEL